MDRTALIKLGIPVELVSRVIWKGKKHPHIFECWFDENTTVTDASAAEFLAACEAEEEEGAARVKERQDERRERQEKQARIEKALSNASKLGITGNDLARLTVALPGNQELLLLLTTRVLATKQAVLSQLNGPPSEDSGTPPESELEPSTP